LKESFGDSRAKKGLRLVSPENHPHPLRFPTFPIRSLDSKMRRTVPLSHLIYNALYPNPGPSDPPSFSAHLAKNLVPEVRIETATFYGSLESAEARYPGLNYASTPHRRRLGRFPHHARLFQVFDDLRLTESEIWSFCRWEGTLWARRRYERDEGVTVEDTTGNEIGPWVDPRKRRKENDEEDGLGRGRLGHGSKNRRRRLGEADDEARKIKVETDIDIEIEDAPLHGSRGGSSSSTALPASTSIAAASASLATPSSETDDEMPGLVSTTSVLPSFRSVFAQSQFSRTTVTATPNPQASSSSASSRASSSLGRREESNRDQSSTRNVHDILSTYRSPSGPDTFTDDKPENEMMYTGLATPDSNSTAA
jgi:hypothetical protein